MRVSSWSRVALVAAAAAIGAAGAGAAQENTADPERLCDSGSADACATLGVAAEEGTDGAPANPARAATLFERACSGGSQFGCRRFALLLQKGEGLPADAARAARLYQDACDEGDAASCWLLGDLYHDGEGVPRDDSRAAEFLQQACDGMAYSCGSLAQAYLEGAGVAKDPARAAVLLMRACDDENFFACRELGQAYSEGSFVPRNPPLAARLLTRACDGDNPYACDDLATAYLSGNGVSADPERAVQLLQRACDGDNSFACLRLAQSLASGEDGIPRDPARAAALMRRACDGDNPYACDALGEAYWDGSFVETNEARARELFGRACDGGVSEACTRLHGFEGMRLVAIGDRDGARVAYLLGADEGLVTATQGERAPQGRIGRISEDAVEVAPVGADAEVLSLFASREPEPLSDADADGVPISIDFDGDVAAFAALVSDFSGLDVLLEPGTRGPVSCAARNAPWDGVAKRALAAGGFEYRIDPQGLRIGRAGTLHGPPAPIETSGKPVSLMFRDGELADVMALFRDIAERPVTYPAGSHEPLTIYTRGRPWDDILAWVAASRGWTLQVDPSGVVLEAAR